MKFEKMLLATLIVCLPGIAAAQHTQSTQTSQTGETTKAQPSDKKQGDAAVAARRTREQKQDQSKAAKVWDNDNIPSKPDAITVLGEQNSATSGTDQNMAAAPNATAQNSKAAEARSKEKEAISRELSSAKDHLQDLNKDLDLLSRKYALDQQDYYSKTNYASDKEGAAKMRDEQDQIDSKKQEIADAQKKIDELTEKLNQSASDRDKVSANPQ